MTVQIAPHDPAFFDPIVFTVPERLVPHPPWVGHIPFAFWIVAALKPRRLVELGTASGNSYAAFTQAVRLLSLQTQCFAVDHWQGDEHSSFYEGTSMYDELKSFHDQRNADFSVLLRMSFDDALGRFQDGSIDLLHIDGFHTYEAVSHDFESWLPKMSSRGVVLFHDIAVHESDFGVWRFWAEVTERFPTAFAFRHSNGLGVLYVGTDAAPEPLAALCRGGDPAWTAFVRDYFAALGRGLMERYGRQQGEAEAGRLTTQREHEHRQHEASLAALREEYERAVGLIERERRTHQDALQHLNHQAESAREQLRAEIADTHALAQGAQDTLRRQHLDEIARLEAAASAQRQAFGAENAKLVAHIQAMTENDRVQDAALAQSAEAIAQLNAALGAAQTHRAHLEAEQRRVETEQQRLQAEQQRLRAEHRRALAERAQVLAESERERERLRVEVDHVHGVVLEKQATIEALAGSTSWKLTKPLRAVMRLMKGEMSVGDTVRRVRTGPARMPPAVSRPASPLLELAPKPDSGEPAASEEGPLRVRAPRGSDGRPTYPLPGYVTVNPLLTNDTERVLDVAVSIVIPTYNAGAEFYWLLRKLSAQTGVRTLEIVIVDSGSSDGTDALAERFGAKLVRIDKAQFSHSFARNTGADAAQGDLLLFSVQDAYPVGDRWVYAMAKLLLEPPAGLEKLGAVSASEFSRADSEVLYDALIDTHYRFLQCRAGDRIGRLVSDDQVDLRVQGQLSDIACLVPRVVFQRFRYEGDYAEDLLLGIRLIREGYQVGLLSSIQVVHSHNRPSAYHVRRVFVDVAFLRNIFPDFAIPRTHSVLGCLLGAASLQPALRRIWPDPSSDGAELLEDLIEELAALELSDRIAPAPLSLDLGLPALRGWLEAMNGSGATQPRPATAEEREDAKQLREIVVDRLKHIVPFVRAAMGVADASAIQELNDAVAKTFAMALGAQFAFRYLNALDAGRDDAPEERLDALKSVLTAGV